MAALALDILQRQVARPDLTELYRYDGYLVITSRRVGNWRGGPSGPGLAVSGVSPFVPG